MTETSLENLQNNLLYVATYIVQRSQYYTIFPQVWQKWKPTGGILWIS